jgi:hypothetical protein
MCVPKTGLDAKKVTPTQFNGNEGIMANNKATLKQRKKAQTMPLQYQ